MTKNLKKQSFPKAYAKELLRIAEGDVASAVGLSQLTTGRPENIVFLAQQADVRQEKIFKTAAAVLVHHSPIFYRDNFWTSTSSR